jgi:hypothetical protein
MGKRQRLFVIRRFFKQLFSAKQLHNTKKLLIAGQIIKQLHTFEQLHTVK